MALALSFEPPNLSDEGRTENTAAVANKAQARARSVASGEDRSPWAPGYTVEIVTVAEILTGPPRVVKIFISVEGSRSSMMDVEDEHNHMRAAFGLRDRFGQPATPAAE
jgi:hypothetical protein